MTIFAESQRGTGEGFGPWDRPGATMTNGTAENTVASVNGTKLEITGDFGTAGAIAATLALLLAGATVLRDVSTVIGSNASAAAHPAGKLRSNRSARADTGAAA